MVRRGLALNTAHGALPKPDALRDTRRTLTAPIMWPRSNTSAASAKRMTAMMTRVGVGAAVLGDPRTLPMRKLARRRCRRCSSTDLCERWLAGKVEGGNSFCLNAQAFRLLKGVNLQEPAGAPVDTRSASYPGADTEIAMKTIAEKSKHTSNANNSPAPLRLQEVMSISQREQANTFIQFLNSRRSAKWQNDQKTPKTQIAFDE